MKGFSAEKFCALPKQQQHKKCAEMLRKLYQQRNDSAAHGLLEEYQKLCSLLSLPQIISLSIDDIEGRFHEHMKASGRGIHEADFLCNLSTEDKSEGSSWLNIHTFLDGLRSAHNVGNIVRTIEAFRLGPLHLSADMMPKDHPQLIKTSMNTWEAVDIRHGTPLELLPKPIIAVETVSTAPTWKEWIYPFTCTIALGNEERGIRKEILQQCDAIVTIPLLGQKNSLNVANAFTVIAAEASSQHCRNCLEIPQCK